MKKEKKVEAFGNRVLVQVDKVYKFDGKKPLIDEGGNHLYEPSQAAKVVHSNVEEVKKGDTVYPIIRGGVPLYHLETKKNFTISLDVEDIYAIEK